MSAPDITVATALLANEIITDTTMIPPAVKARADSLFPSAVALITHHAARSTADVAILNAAVVRVFGYMYDSDPSEPRANRNPFMESGAAALMAPFARRGVAVAGDEDLGDLIPPVVPQGLPIPDLPDDGENYILTGDSTTGLRWVKFPLPGPRL